MRWDGTIECCPLQSIRAVYVVVPKAACTSVKWALSHFRDAPVPHEPAEIHRSFGYTHSVKNVWELQQLLGSTWASHFRFTVVRDPVARFRSFFRDIRSPESGASADINEYVLQEFGDDEWRWNIHAAPQTAIIGTDLGVFDFVGHVENIPEVEHELDWRYGPVRLPHLNRSDSHEEHLSSEAEERLREIYRADYQVLGYD